MSEFIYNLLIGAIDGAAYTVYHECRNPVVYTYEWVAAYYAFQEWVTDKYV